MYYWLNLLEAGNERKANQAIIDKKYFKNVIVYNDNFHWLPNDWRGADDIHEWFKTLPTQLVHSYHSVETFKLLSFEEMKSKAVFNNLDVLARAVWPHELICFTMRFHWNVLRIDGKTLMEARTEHYWVVVDNMEDDFPKIARTHVNQSLPFTPLFFEE